MYVAVNKAALGSNKRIKGLSAHAALYNARIDTAALMSWPRQRGNSSLPGSTLTMGCKQHHPASTAFMHCTLQLCMENENKQFFNLCSLTCLICILC
jgi:hypothetical protein